MNFNLLVSARDYKLLNIVATPFELLLKHHKIAKEVGLDYVYIGNVPGNPYEHTYCPGCKERVIERHGFMITAWRLDEKYNCMSCGYKIPITGKEGKAFHLQRHWKFLHTQP